MSPAQPRLSPSESMVAATSRESTEILMASSMAFCLVGKKKTKMTWTRFVAPIGIPSKHSDEGADADSNHACGRLRCGTKTTGREGFFRRPLTVSRAHPGVDCHSRDPARSAASRLPSPCAPAPVPLDPADTLARRVQFRGVWQAGSKLHAPAVVFRRQLRQASMLRPPRRTPVCKH